MRISDWSSDVCSSDLPTKNVAAMAAMGGIQGGAIGGGLGAIPRGQRQADRDRSDATIEGRYGDVDRERAAQEAGQAGAASGESAPADNRKDDGEGKRA